MQLNEGIGQRPVYVLGAGFSRAIHEHMPLTDDLGDAVKLKLGIQWPPGQEQASFEERLTLLSTPLPFLEGHENTRRRAQAEQITAALAIELDERTASASAGEPPAWLTQLVALWHAERAVVITFNYDTLVERAVTSLRPVALRERDNPPTALYGSQIAYPAPTAVGVRTYRDMAGPTGESFQLLELHGSLNWYWALGDGATVVREPFIHGFGRPAARSGPDLAGTRTLDRFLVPPVLSKDSYYNVNLVSVLWRSAYEAVRNASRLTIIGYSMPLGDRIAAELLREAAGVPVDIVNWRVGSEEEETSPLGRAKLLGFSPGTTLDGADSVPKYVADRVANAAASLASNSDLNDLDHASVVATVQLPDRELGPHSFTIRSRSAGVAEGCDLDWSRAARSEMPPTEFSLQSLPSGTSRLDDFFTGAGLMEAVRHREPFWFQIGQRKYLAIGVQRAHLGRWPILELSTAPA